MKHHFKDSKSSRRLTFNLTSPLKYLGVLLCSYSFSVDKYLTQHLTEDKAPTPLNLESPYPPESTMNTCDNEPFLPSTPPQNLRVGKDVKNLNNQEMIVYSWIPKSKKGTSHMRHKES